MGCEKARVFGTIRSKEQKRLIFQFYSLTQEGLIYLMHLWEIGSRNYDWVINICTAWYWMFFQMQRWNRHKSYSQEQIVFSRKGDIAFRECRWRAITFERGNWFLPARREKEAGRGGFRKKVIFASEERRHWSVSWNGADVDGGWGKREVTGTERLTAQRWERAELAKQLEIRNVAFDIWIFGALPSGSINIYWINEWVSEWRKSHLI